MALQTRINGFTTWANYRLQLVGHDSMDNVMTDFMKGYNLKMLVESITGRPFRKLKTFDGLTENQKETRIQWIVDELKDCGIVDRQIKVDCRLVALRVLDNIVDLLWYLVSFDIEFIWARSGYMTQYNMEKLIACPFLCVPPSWSTSRGEETVNSKTAAMERDDDMILENKLKKSKTSTNCIFELINRHLKMTRDGRKVKCVTNFSDILNIKVFCALVNSIVADTFISDVLLNDRWTLSLILQTINDLLRFPCTFSLDDFIQADNKGLCCYFTFFFMIGYSLRQSKAAVERLEFLTFSTLKCSEELCRLKSTSSTGKDIGRQKELEDVVKDYNKEMRLINANYNISDCRDWARDVSSAQKKVWVSISTHMKRKYEVIAMPMNLSINDLSIQLFVNLDITASHGFYELTYKETVTNERKVIIQNKVSRHFYDYNKLHDGKKQRSARNVLGISSASAQELNPKHFPEFHIFVETLSSNKSLRAGSLFLYQIFPDDMTLSQNLLFKAVKNGELDTVKNLISFFQAEPSFVSGVHGNAKTTALHLACRLAKFDLVLYLLEQNADINIQNCFGNTPLHVAIENGPQNGRLICKLLVEWGANVRIVNKNKLTPLADLKNGDFCMYLQNVHDYWEDATPRLVGGDLELLRSIIQVDKEAIERVSTLRSRCAKSSTLLHIASYYGDVDVITQLLVMGVDINILDERFATPLHKARSCEVVKLLIKYGGDISLTDVEKNTALHCLLGKRVGNDIDCEAIAVLVSKGIGMLQRNAQGFTSIHCAAIIGKVDAIKTLLRLDSGETLKMTLNSDIDAPSSSVVYLAIENGHLSCARWLLENGFRLKKHEGGELVHKILMGKINTINGTSTFELLFENGASVNTLYSEGNSCLHLASTSIDMIASLQQFIEHNCDVNQQNNNNWTPLFFATSSNNYQAAALLLKHGADITLRDTNGLTAFDYIQEYDHWIACGYFDDIIVETLHAYSFKKTRDLVRSITEKLKKAELKEL